jgi:eukaryotic-like serine/threonine-protein kinase
MGEAFGHYTILEQLGVGGMATVHRAEVLVDGQVRTVALKRLLPELARETSYVRRFVDEARLGQCLRHANIARTFEVGCVETTHFIAFEYVRGVTLLRLMQHASTTKPIPIDATVHIITQVARALAYAHGARSESGQPLNLIHRDIAPGNIMIAETGSTKLIDFGVAKTRSAHVSTGVGSVIGKLGYVAPEYLHGKLDHRVDLFSLGVVAYELLTARKLYDVEDLRSAESMRATEVLPPSRRNPLVPFKLDEIVMQALQREPSARWQTAYDMYIALSKFADESGFATTDREIAAWLATELAQLPPQKPSQMVRTAEIEIEIEEAFARARASSNVTETP